MCALLPEYLASEFIKVFACLTHMSMKYVLVLSIKMPTIYDENKRHYTDLYATKPVKGISYKVILKQACSATETS